MEENKCTHNQVTVRFPGEWKGEKYGTYYDFKIPELYSDMTADCDDCGEKVEVNIGSF